METNLRPKLTYVILCTILNGDPSTKLSDVAKILSFDLEVIFLGG